MKKKKSDEDSSKEEEDSSEEESGGGKVEYDIKKSNSCYAYYKKKKIITRNGSGWTGSAVGKKPCEKFSMKLLSNISNIMYGFCQDNKYTQNSCNYSNGHTWYVNSSCLYGTSFYNNSSTFPTGETTPNTVYGVVYNKKKRRNSFL